MRSGALPLRAADAGGRCLQARESSSAGTRRAQPAEGGRRPADPPSRSSGRVSRWRRSARWLWRTSRLAAALSLLGRAG